MIQGGRNDRISHNFSSVDRLVLAWVSCDWRIAIGGNMAVYQATVCFDSGMPGADLLHYNTADPTGGQMFQVCVWGAYIKVSPVVRTV